mgnify:CR=1 FL=1
MTVDKADHRSHKNNKNASLDFMDAFYAFMYADFSDVLENGEDIAVAVSGGADSMALCHALSRMHSGHVYAITVDHGLRPEARVEAEYVAQVFVEHGNLSHHILTWAHDDAPHARVQEQARAARYALMAGFMREKGVRCLFLGHHMDDQAETFLFRLAKGSGLDGLSCMAARAAFDDGGVFLCRPMLSLPKADMVAYCAAQGIEYIDDPSNQSDKYARVRLRQSMEVLATEGLTPKRLSVTASRIARAREALDIMSDRAYNHLSKKNNERIEINLKSLVSEPQEIVLRVVLRAMDDVITTKGYGARMERVESLCEDLRLLQGFRKRTLGGIIFEVRAGGDSLILHPERNEV